MHNFTLIKIFKIDDKGDGKHFLGYTEQGKIINLVKTDGYRYVEKDGELEPLELTRYDFIN